jgi:class 3 adenylate cyclase
VRHEDGRFCATCGSQLVTTVDAAKYKQVTVLFADVVRSMDIAATLDAERLRDIMTELVERSASVIHRYAGPGGRRHVAHRDLAIRYRAMAHSLGFEGHIDWAEAMIEDMA